MSELALSLAQQARRVGLLTTLRQLQRQLTIERLDGLVRRSKYGHELASITVAELRELPPPDRSRADVERMILAVFERHPNARLTSGFFIKHERLNRWTAQTMLAELAERGVLVRKGKTSGTRYHLAPRSPTRGG